MSWTFNTNLTNATKKESLLSVYCILMLTKAKEVKLSQKQNETKQHRTEQRIGKVNIHKTHTYILDNMYTSSAHLFARGSSASTTEFLSK